MARAPGSRAWRWLAAAVALLALGGAWLLRSPRANRPPPIVRMPGAGEPAEGRSTESAVVNASPDAHVVGAGGLLPGDTAGQSEADRYLARMAETRRALLDKTRYPVESRPLATKTDLLQPHHVEPTMRGLSGEPGKSHGVLITQNQDRVYVSPGQPAVAFLTALSGNSPAGLTIQRSDLVRQLEDGQGNVLPGGPVVGHPTFLDDGNPPDVTAGDGTWTAAVTLPNDGSTGAVVLSVDASADGEQGTLLYSFVETASAPATFTQTARDALEDGSIAIYVGIQVQKPGPYEIVGRLYDSTGAPLVYMRFMDTLTTSSTEVRLLAFGKVILDEGGVPPFVLRDVEGALILVGQYPDRAPMTDWPAGYTTAAYPLSQLSDADYNGADKQRKIAALDEAAKEGLANIQKNPTPTLPPPAATGPTTH